MPKITKKKKANISEDDVIRRFVTFHIEASADDADTKLSSKDRAEIVETILVYYGDVLTNIVVSAAEIELQQYTDGEEGEEEEE